jgi:hypothetical protein
MGELENRVFRLALAKPPKSLPIVDGHSFFIGQKPRKVGAIAAASVEQLGQKSVEHLRAI